MKLTLLFLVTPLLASSPARKREVCIVDSLDDPKLNDAPAINQALKNCGDTGRIVLSANQTYHIRSPLDLSSCQACDFQINGILSIVPDQEYWAKQTAVIKVSRTTAAIIHSDGNTGIIDANRFGWSEGKSLLGNIPKLFSIGNESYQIHVRNLKIKNTPGTVFHVHSNSSATRFYGIDFLDAAEKGYLVEQAQHVYVWNNTIRATVSCVTLLPNSSNFQVEDSACITSGTASQSGFGLRSETNNGLNWIRNVFVKNIKAIGRMDVITFSPGTGEGTPHPFEIGNVTFTDINISGPAQRAVDVQSQGEDIMSATDVMFRNFSGEVQEESNLQCAGTESQCDFKTAGWQLAVQKLGD